ncbi:PLD nuclease N-terminal domain-containing protein [Antrihabitans sp. YC2-6]|uniref:PLD nuclease N-terminal domain-containing protein n=1 Tax=Antrihabitans sp. YC2-6 TaxID=2799498 RepID=UPI0018F2A0B5|nr:PLD nuclease N-terminal domain-containing protein [Antrihabitans sp. YC2-6]MBJ8345875.1 PLDc N-terminal domain-containing protein [Antrihabitans sp. YC2-6]
MPYVLVGLITLALWVYCVVDVITCPEHATRNLPKIAWLIVVLIIPTIGSILWLVAGRPVGGQRMSNTRFGEYDRPGRQVAQNPEDDEAFLRRLRERAESQRREAQRQEEQRQRDQERRWNSGEG